MIYNPYLQLVPFAALSVLKDSDHLSYLYPAQEGYVCVGALQASRWLTAGKPQSRDQQISNIMEDVAHLTQHAPFSPEVAQKLVEQGFDWLVKYEIEDSAPIPFGGWRSTEAI